MTKRAVDKKPLGRETMDKIDKSITRFDVIVIVVLIVVCGFIVDMHANDRQKQIIQACTEAREVK